MLLQMAKLHSFLWPSNIPLFVFVCIYTHTHIAYLVYIYVCMYMYMFIYVYINKQDVIYMHTHTHTHTHTQWNIGHKKDTTSHLIGWLIQIGVKWYLIVFFNLHFSIFSPLSILGAHVKWMGLEMPWSDYVLDHICIGLFLGSYFCSIDLCVCFYASTILFWLL